MKILFIGDIVARPGRDIIKKRLLQIKQEEGIHLVIANGENASHGKGITMDDMKELQQAGISYFTSGNHIWNIKETVSKMYDKNVPILRPANYPNGNPGRGYAIVETTLLKKVLIINLQGRVFMPEGLECPFRTIDGILEQYANDPTISAIFVDMHAEATSEKHALRHYLDGRVTALVGTHTHVMTNDATVTPKGMAYITDVGMTGVYWDSVIGVEQKHSLDLFLLGNAQRWDRAEGSATLHAVVIETDDATKKAIHIKPIIMQA